jgi:hypothetical protein
LVTSGSALNVCVCPKSSMVTISSNSYWSLPFPYLCRAGRHRYSFENWSSLTSRSSILDRIKAFSSV